MASSMLVRASRGAAARAAASAAASRCPAAAAAASGSGGGGAGAASYRLLLLRGSPAVVASSSPRFGRAGLSSYPNLDDDNMSCDSDDLYDIDWIGHHIPDGHDGVDDDDSAESESYSDDSDGEERVVLDRSRAHWNAGLEKGLVELLHDHNNDYYRSQSGWSPNAWRRIVKLFYDKFPYVKFTKTQIRDKVRVLKWEYRLLKKARKQSGASWDDKLCRIVADQSVWDNIITSHPSAKKFQNKSFPLFDALGELCDGKTAERTLNFTSIAPSQVTQPSHAAQPPSQATVTQDYVGEEDEVFSYDFPAHNVKTDDEDLRILEQPVVCDAAAKSRMGKRVASTRNKDNATSDKTKEAAQRCRQDGQVVELMERFTEMKEKQAEAEVAQQEKARTNANEEFPIPVCIFVVDKMEELSDDEKVLAYGVFKDAQNRSIFMSAKASTRLKWLRKEITSHY